MSELALETGLVVVWGWLVAGEAGRDAQHGVHERDRRFTGRIFRFGTDSVESGKRLLRLLEVVLGSRAW